MEKENNHQETNIPENNIPDNPPTDEPKLGKVVEGFFIEEEFDDDEYHNCPECGVVWGIEEICFQECFSCGYPDNDGDWDDWEDFEYDDYSEEEEAEIRQEEDFYNGIEPLEDQDQECSNDDDLPF
jgi:hypothetical protein